MSLPAYDSYRETAVDWIGTVPSHWDVKSLKRGLRLITGRTARRSWAVGLENIEGWTGRLVETDADFEGEGVGFESGDVLYGKLRPYLAKVHVADRPGEAVGDFHVLRAQNGVLPQFVGYQLRTHEVVSQLNGSTFGARMPRVGWEFMGGLPLAFPPFAEQAAIAAFLDRETGKIDALVEAQKRLIELLKEKRQAAIAHAVTKGLDPTVPVKDSGVEWLGEMPAHWQVTALKRSWSVADCKHLTAEFVDDGVPLASIREVQSRFVNLEGAKQTTESYFNELIEGGRCPEAGDLIFSRNATVGEVAEVGTCHPPFAMGQDVCLLRRQSLKSSSAFLYHVIRSRVVREQLAVAMIGSTFKRVNVEEIRDLIIPTPPPSEQQAIAAFIEKKASGFDDLIAQATAASSLLKERRSALISAAVTGKIDVGSLSDRETEAA